MASSSILDYIFDKLSSFPVRNTQNSSAMPSTKRFLWSERSLNLANQIPQELHQELININLLSPGFSLAPNPDSKSLDTVSLLQPKVGEILDFNHILDRYNGNYIQKLLTPVVSGLLQPQNFLYDSSITMKANFSMPLKVIEDSMLLRGLDLSRADFENSLNPMTSGVEEVIDISIFSIEDCQEKKINNHNLDLSLISVPTVEMEQKQPKSIHEVIPDCKPLDDTIVVSPIIVDNGSCEINIQVKVCNEYEKLNKELAIRKTKQITKHSKKRRKRQKKKSRLSNNLGTDQAGNTNENDIVEDQSKDLLCITEDDVDGSSSQEDVHFDENCTDGVEIPSPYNCSIFVPVSSSDEHQDWDKCGNGECNVNGHSSQDVHCEDVVEISSPYKCSFFVPISSSGSSDEDLDWDKCGGDGESDIDVSFSRDDENCIDAIDGNVEVLSPYKCSFFIPVDSSDDDSDTDWDTCDGQSDLVPDASEFEFTGLFLTNLTATKPLVAPVDKALTVLQCSVGLVTFGDELDEASVYETLLYKVNKSWNEATKDLCSKPKLPTKVSFAPDCSLVQSQPIEMYERKGEWGMYALERLRFRRRINKLESILAPCFSTEHRDKVFQRLLCHQL